MRKYKLVFTFIATYLLVFAAVSLHRTSSGYRRTFSFKRIRPIKKQIYENISEEHKLTPVITRVFSIKAPSEPGE